jgi:hypothetical protein
MDINQLKVLESKFEELMHNLAYGTKHSSLIRSMSGITSGNIIHVPPISHRGFVFFGKPKLNLMPSNIKNDRILSCLNTTSPDSLAFAIRCMLDPIYASGLYSSDSQSIRSKIAKSPLIRTDLPFIPILTNLLDELSGWNDPSIETESTEGGFYSENMTTAKGGEDGTKTINLSAKFSDIQGSPIFILFMIWCRWIMLSMKGVVAPYYIYDEQNKISYSISIYRFRLDRSGRFITYWSRGCMCFPTSYPVTDKANYNKEETLTLHKDITIPIVVNFPEYMDPITLLEFNMWIKRWCKGIEQYDILNHDELEYFRHLAVPYIDFTNGKKELQWRINPSLHRQNPEKEMEKLLDEIKSLTIGGN